MSTLSHQHNPFELLWFIHDCGDEVVERDGHILLKAHSRRRHGTNEE